MNNKIKIILVSIGIFGLFLLFKFLPVADYLRQALNWIEGLGPLAGAVFIILYAIAAVLLVPGSALTLGAGAAFGVIEGSIYVSIASTLGAVGAFVVGRYFAREWVSKKVAGNKKFEAVDNAVGKEGWKIVGLTRLSPVFPYTLLNYMYGLTRVKLFDYALASWIGMMPGTVMYVYLGSLAGDSVRAAAGGTARTPQEWALYAIGLLATIAVTVYVTKIARKALKEKVGEG